jgi:hypothetical protein
MVGRVGVVFARSVARGQEGFALIVRGARKEQDVVRVTWNDGRGDIAVFFVCGAFVIGFYSGWKGG